MSTYELDIEDTLWTTGSVSAFLVQYVSFAKNVAELLDLIWPHFLNGCELCRPTDAWLLEVGPWKEKDLKWLAGEGSYNTIPSIVGSLTK